MATEPNEQKHIPTFSDDYREYIIKYMEFFSARIHNLAALVENYLKELETGKKGSSYEKSIIQYKNDFEENKDIFRQAIKDYRLALESEEKSSNMFRGELIENIQKLENENKMLKEKNKKLEKDLKYPIKITPILGGKQTKRRKGKKKGKTRKH